MDNKQYLIADARKEQIITAAIAVLNEIGYINTSLSKIAKQANISTGLISYHFSGKEDLMRNTLMYLVLKERAFIKEKVESKQTYQEKLLTFIEAGIAYQGTNGTNTNALLEIVFNGRTPDNVPYYLAEIDEREELQALLIEILSKGTESKEFADVDPYVTALMIRSSISSVVSLPRHEQNLSLEEYSEKLINNVLKIIK
ncbi:AcrR family transcriptional regulator [Alkalihalobacillus xiaoxiensis]|uniref:AcrR family transcriptional regulator n=1 Tax=Shouchella xiaoxiensis TaxID=766895 RepID=A0ABS2SW88_9BACI|nr:TetR/AcrR family transcriptional regulator [Shouchella xiaoxiensis]MBM7839798.1 AcrR family transcriptional regulator [Shouchella xiaoxiensis]